jgi:hypothetical protein
MVAGAAPEADGTLKVTLKGVVEFKFEDNFKNAASAAAACCCGKCDQQDADRGALEACAPPLNHRSETSDDFLKAACDLA